MTNFDAKRIGETEAADFENEKSEIVWDNIEPVSMQDAVSGLFHNERDDQELDELDAAIIDSGMMVDDSYPEDSSIESEDDSIESSDDGYFDDGTDF